MGQRKEQPEESVKTSLKIPRRLWREARIRAMDEGTDLQSIVAKALEAYLKKGGAK
jgi:predicted GNAT superfamily acetyltransferase